MIENTDAEQIERLNSRVADLMRQLASARKALLHIRGLEGGSRGAYGKFTAAQSIAMRALGELADNKDSTNE